MKLFRIAISVACLVTLAMASPALAKKAVKAEGGKGKGAYCEQGGQNAFFPAAQFPANIRNRLVKGRKIRFNYPGYGMISCVVY
jgi:hypothetical protein